MAGKINRMMNLARNMGWRYVAFRSRYEVRRRCGLLKRKFPARPAFQQFITLAEWKQQKSVFFFNDKGSLNFPRRPTPVLKEAYENIRAGKLMFFGSLLVDLGARYDWVTNPDSGFRYDVNKHWTEIADYSKQAGDIKFTWEKSRFSYLYDIIRYDYHYNVDCAELVFAEILSWIKANPVNCGPNYRCSQEMSLRVLNWTFALFYYRNSPALTEEVFGQVQYVIYWHMRHVFDNIDFSRIAVRNNHAITETLALYLVGIFYPSLPGAAEWKKKGKQWFEEEIAYQVYEDGTYLQFSMNYHRVVVQLLTWGIVLSEKNGERFADAVYDRAKKSVIFLCSCMGNAEGWLPNYGANDGALFFKLSGTHFRDYRPQLQALAVAVGMDPGFGAVCEDAHWYGAAEKALSTWSPGEGTHRFDRGGYYIIREPETLTFIKCGSYRDRPSHADNLHLDVWYKGENVLVDAGSYKYNTGAETMRYFSGTQSHNTVAIAFPDVKDQMLKGGRFIWYYWSQCKRAVLGETDSDYTFEGTISAFSYVAKGMQHSRKIAKKKGCPVWTVSDEVLGPLGVVTMQLWHYPSNMPDRLKFESNEEDEEGDDREKLVAHQKDSWYSPLYGLKEKNEACFFATENHIIRTTITVT